MWCPGYSKRMHVVFRFQDMGRVKTVLPARTRDDTVVGAIVLAMAVTEFAQVALPFLPIDVPVLSFGEIAGITNTIAVEMNGFLL